MHQIVPLKLMRFRQLRCDHMRGIHRCPGDSGKYKEHARQSDSITPHAVFSRVRMRRSEPLYDLLSGLWFLGRSRNPTVRFPDIGPESNLIFTWRCRGKVSTPPIRKALEPGAFCWGKPPHSVLCIITDHCCVPWHDYPLRVMHACQRSGFGGEIDLMQLPIAKRERSMRGLRGEQGLVIIAGEGGGKVRLHKSTLPAPLTASADF